MYDRIVENEKDLDELGISVVIAKLLSELVDINDCKDWLAYSSYHCARSHQVCQRKHRVCA